jgi:hypothetical protein
VIAALAYGSWCLRSSLLAGWTGPEARLAEAVIALATLFAVAQLLGAVHLLRPVPILIGELAAAAGLWAAARRWRVPATTRPTRPVTRPTAVQLAIAGGAIGLVVVQWASHVGDALGRGMAHPDTLWYHVPFAAAFVQEHGFTGIDSLGYDAARFFPFNAQVVHALGILAYGRDIASPFVNLGWLALTMLAAWVIGARRGLGLVSVTAVSVGLSLPILTATQPGQASSDLACAALLLAGVALLLESESRPVPIALAGLAVGMSLSTKINVATAIAVLVIGVIVIALWQGRLRNAIVWTVALAVSGSFWFLRDWVVSGSPLPWFELRLGPIHFARQIPPSAPSLAHEVLQPSFESRLYLDGLWQGLGRAWFVILALFFLSTAVLVVRRRDPYLRLVGLVVLAGFVGYVFTPLTGGTGFVYNLRYLAPLLLLAFAIAPLLLPASSRWHTGALLVCLGLVGVSATMPNREQIPAWPSGEVLPAIVAVVVVALVIWGLWRSRSLVAIGVALAVVLMGFWFAQRHYEANRYVADGLATDGIDEYFRNVHDADVVIFGSDASLPLFGLDLSNHVRRGDVPPVDVGASPCAGWRTYLGDTADYVLMMKGEFGYFVVPPDNAIADDPAAHVVLRSGDDTVYAISGPFDPSTCAPGT